MSEYAVHFTKDVGTASAYDNMLSILWSGQLRAVNPYGAAYRLDELGSSQYSACFSEIPLDLLDRLVGRRSHYGIGFRQDKLIQSGGARVWYLDNDGRVAWTFRALIAAAKEGGIDPRDPIWRLTPFVDFPGTYGASPFRFEWEREWRVPGGLHFAPDDVAFLFLPEAWHSAARSFFGDYARDNTGAGYVCPYIDPTWDIGRIRQALAALPRPALASVDEECPYCRISAAGSVCVACGEIVL